MILSIIAVLCAFGLVIFLHELGHFTVCKLTGIKVEAFSFGFGPELLGHTKGDTRYSLRLVPLGGYVKPAGENIEEVSGAPDEYFAKPWYVRLGVVAAGPTMNYLLAFVLFSGAILFVGEPVFSTEAVIGDLTQGYPAETAGLKPGDRVLKVDGVTVSSWAEMAGHIYPKMEKDVTIDYTRAGVSASATLKTRKAMDGGPIRGVIGIAPETVYARVSFFKSMNMGLHLCWYYTAITVKTLASNIYHRQKPDLSGPIGIVTIISKAVHTGMTEYVLLLAAISVAVGFFNLLPIPILDGGWALLFIFEGVFRRKVTPKIMQYINGTGMAMLLSILLFATYSDIMRIVRSHADKKAAAAQVQVK